MQYLKFLFFIFFFLGSALVGAEQKDYDDCILKHLKGAKLDIATDTIRRACYENYKKTSFISEKNRAYNNCLLEHLPGVESLQAVMEIKSACERKYK